MEASGLRAEGSGQRFGAEARPRSDQSLADAVAMTRGCSAAVLLAPDGGVIASAPQGVAFPAAAMTALQRPLAVLADAPAFTVLLPRHTVVARQLSDHRILVGLVAPGADSVALRAALESVLPAGVSPPPAGPGQAPPDTRAASVPMISTGLPKPSGQPAVRAVPSQGVEATTLAPASGASSKERRRRHRRGVLAGALLLALLAGIGIGASLWAWFGPALSTRIIGSAQPTSEVIWSTASPTPEASPTPLPTIPVPAISLSYAGDLAHGSSGEAVRALQARLRQLRYFVYPEETGFFGDATYGAVYTFQRDRGLPPTGIADQTTVAALNACDERCRY